MESGHDVELHAEVTVTGVGPGCERPIPQAPGIC
jgi:hypothetical protein